MAPCWPEKKKNQLSQCCRVVDTHHLLQGLHTPKLHRRHYTICAVIDGGAGEGMPIIAALLMQADLLAHPEAHRYRRHHTI